MKIISILLFLMLSASSISAQEYFVYGTAREEGSGTPLSFVNIRISGSSSGTAANREGNYELRLKNGSYTLIASYIGYISDTLDVEVNNRNVRGADFNLVPSKVDLPEITVLPGENPAFEIIRKAIARKHDRNGKINSYEFEAYTKGLIRSEEEISAGSNSVGIQSGSAEEPLKIAGIIENKSKNYFKKPNDYKEIITARKQTVNLPASLNVFTGGRLIQNFYEEEINFINKPMPGPLADDALSYYYYYIEGMVRQDGKNIYKISLSPDDPSDPGFLGNIYIADSTYDLVRVEMSPNRAANPGGIFDSIGIYQQFSEFGDGIYMPVDYRLFVKANILGLARIGFELNSILHDYNINADLKDDLFDMAVVKVLPEADKKDSLFWENTLTIPNTEEEITAYNRIDSIANVPSTVWDNFQILNTRFKLTDNFAVSAPLGMYHFNRVEGHTADFGLFFDKLFDNRLEFELANSYGFSDKKWKKSFFAEYLMGEYRTYFLNFEAYDRLNILFGSSENYNEITSTILALFTKYEFRDYYYSKGIEFGAGGEVFPVLSLHGGYSNRTDNSAFKNTDFAVFGKGKSYSANPPVNEIKIASVKAGFDLDLRKYIEDGQFRRRITGNRSYILLGGEAEHSSTGWLKSGIDFTRYTMYTRGRINTFGGAALNFRVNGIYNEGTLPYQQLYALPGNIDIASKPFSFRTLEVNEVFGEQAVTVFVEHNWSDALFRLLDIPGVKNWELLLTTFVNAAYTSVGNKTAGFIPFNVKTFENPFFEIGFGIGHMLVPMQLDFSWKLNHRGENNFRVGISTIAI